MKTLSLTLLIVSLLTINLVSGKNKCNNELFGFNANIPFNYNWSCFAKIKYNPNYQYTKKSQKNKIVITTYLRQYITNSKGNINSELKYIKAIIFPKTSSYILLAPLNNLIYKYQI